MALASAAGPSHVHLRPRDAKAMPIPKGCRSAAQGACARQRRVDVRVSSKGRRRRSARRLFQYVSVVNGRRHLGTPRHRRPYRTKRRPWDQAVVTAERCPKKSRVAAAGSSVPRSLCGHIRQQLLQFARLVHLAHDVRAADEFAVDVELRNRRPVGVVLDALADVGIGEDVDGKERFRRRRPSASAPPRWRTRIAETAACPSCRARRGGWLPARESCPGCSCS